MKALRLLCAVIALTAVPAAAPAQQTESRVTGRVVDQSQGALPGVTVTVTSKATGVVATSAALSQARRPDSFHLRQKHIRSR